MTSDLDAKGPHVHLDAHNPERDNPGTHAASQPDNDPNGIAARLLRLAQQFEDQHAPMTMTLLLREAAETLEYLGQVGQLSDELERVRDATLEEAAELVEQHTPRYGEGDFRGYLIRRMAYDSIGLPYAAAIRALKGDT